MVAIQIRSSVFHFAEKEQKALQNPAQPDFAVLFAPFRRNEGWVGKGKAVQWNW
jgi:hypothetical protein